jgi:hypothetical protein
MLSGDICRSIGCEDKRAKKAMGGREEKKKMREEGKKKTGMGRTKMKMRKTKMKRRDDEMTMNKYATCFFYGYKLESERSNTRPTAILESVATIDLIKKTSSELSIRVTLFWYDSLF